MNLKKLWCEFTCNPRQADYVRGLGHTKKVINDAETTLSEIRYYVDDDVACTMFKSCMKVALIAQASVQTSQAFLDFMGVNGEDQGLSVISFQLGSHKSKDSITKRCSLNEEESELLRKTQEAISDDKE